MVKDYLIWNEKLEIRNFAKTNVLKLAVHKNLNGREKLETYTINDTASEIIRLIDGTRTYEEIISVLSLKYEENPISIEAKLTSFLDSLLKQYKLKVTTRKFAERVPVNMVEEKTLYPQVASIEITNKCNVRCRHCYGNFGEGILMSLGRVKSLLDDLEQIGVKAIELTGGDITVHPDLKEILLYALDLKFDQISLLTNGINLSDNIIDVVVKNSSRVQVQIDMHSLNDGYLEWFFQIPKSPLNKIQSNIMKLAAHNVNMRIATIVTPSNVQEVESIADWVHSKGIKSFGVSPVTAMGRALAHSDLYLNEEESNRLGAALLNVQKKYPKFLSLNEGTRSEIRNCGAITSHVVISPNGKTKICTMDNIDVNSSFGNVFEKNIKEIYNDKSEYVKAFLNLQTPQLDLDECKDCVHKNFCYTCFVRSFMKAKEIGAECKWYQKYVPNH